MSKRIIVAIDGPAGAGKSTVARRVAKKLDFIYIDTGAMYRAVALWALRTGVDSSDMHRLEQLAAEASIEFPPGNSRVLLNGEDVSDAIRTPAVSETASKISAVAGVRRALVEKQRRIGQAGSVVMEGRDIGSVVFPDAEVKIYLDADSQVRAGRRALELDRPSAEVAREIADRDRRDRGRKDSPLLQPPDAIYVDTSGLDLDQVEELVLKLIRERTSNGKEYAR
jgi:cytidylate kinase